MELATEIKFEGNEFGAKVHIVRNPGAHFRRLQALSPSLADCAEKNLYSHTQFTEPSE